MDHIVTGSSPPPSYSLMYMQPGETESQQVQTTSEQPPLYSSLYDINVVHPGPPAYSTSPPSYTEPASTITAYDSSMGGSHEQHTELWDPSTTRSNALIIHPATMMVGIHDAELPSDQFCLSAAAILCCMPLGLFAVVKSIECRLAISRRQLELAELLSHQAKSLAGIAIGFGVFMFLFLIGFNMRDKYLQPF